MLEPLPLVDIVPNFCPRDGTPLGDEMKAGTLRRVCPSCGYIYGRDPRVVVTLLITQNDELVFVARNDGWSLPLYFFAAQEDPRALLTRMFAEETGLQVQPGEVMSTFSADAQVLGHLLVLVFRGHLEPASLIDGSKLTTMNPRVVASLSSTSLTRAILARISDALPT
jgi:ADP-ribose pyrophosphatase YjhB (NUDIX family)